MVKRDPYEVPLNPVDDWQMHISDREKESLREKQRKELARKRQPFESSSWKLWEVIVSMLIALFASTVLVLMAIASVRSSSPLRSRSQAIDELGIMLIVIAAFGIWIGLLGFPWLRSRIRRFSLWKAVNFRMKFRDVPIGLLVGAAVQLLVIPLIYWPLSYLINIDNVSDPAREITDRVATNFEIALLVFVVLVGAPIVEEVFFRGIMFSTLVGRWPTWVVHLFSAVIFAAFHFQLLQLPALFVIGLVLGFMYRKTGRLGTAIWTHAGFNAVVVIFLLADIA